MDDLWKRINLAALLCHFIYSAHKTKIESGEKLSDIIKRLDEPILSSAIKNNPDFAHTVIKNLTVSENGMTAGCTETPNGEIYVIFRGTGSGEWIDNGEGLSGIPEENTYFTYKDGKIIKRTIISKDFASDQQAEALNWFNRMADIHGWKEDSRIYLCGHSKGGNKAQFVFIKTEPGKQCFSFCGQGFSPEAYKAFRASMGEDFEKRRQDIFSISSENDYVNVLGKRLMPKSNVIYLKSQGFHSMKALLDKNGNLNPKTVQGRLSQYAQGISEELMDMPPFIRKYATLGTMNIFQRYLGKGVAVNGDRVSFEETIAGIALTLPSLLNFRK